MLHLEDYENFNLKKKNKISCLLPVPVLQKERKEYTA